MNLRGKIAAFFGLVLVAGAAWVVHLPRPGGLFASAQVSDVPLHSTDRPIVGSKDLAVADPLVAGSRSYRAGSTPPVESQISTKAGLDTRQAARLLKSNDFEKFIERMRDENYTNRDAVALQELYQKRLLERFQNADVGVAVDKLACGISICAAMMSGVPMDNASFSELLMGGAKGEAPIPSAIIQVVGRGNQSSQYRFVFSTDPTSTTLVVPRP